MNTIDKITCPNCSFNFDVEEVLSSKIKEKLIQDFKSEKERWIEDINRSKKALEEQQKSFEEKKKRENEIFKQKLEEALESRKGELRKNMDEEYLGKINLQKEELERKTKQLNALKDKEIELERMRMKMEEQEKEIELRLFKKMQEEMQTKEETIRKRMEEAMHLKLLEKEKMLEQQKKLIEEMKRKSEQGSMQLQGEVQELAIEDYLASQFPLDEIEEIRKGQRGGDCIQVVHTRKKRNCGRIYYESKRTKEFQNSWIEKFKNDIRDKGADLAVLVTQAYPKDFERMGQLNGIWICSFEEFKSLCYVLRDSIIRLDMLKSSQENKGDKMHMLYDYLTSNEFKMQVEGIVEGFTQMQNDLQKEKNAMQRIWNQREKQIQKVLLNTSSLYGSIQGLAGNSIGKIDSLEMPEQP
jgi:hypothetical protein